MMLPFAPYVKWNVISIFGSGTGLLIALEFTQSELVFYGIVAGFLTSLLASLTSILIARQGRAAFVETKAAIVENTLLTGVLSQKTDAIGANVDGLKSKDASIIASLERENALLKQQAVDAAKIAVALAATSPDQVSPPSIGDNVGILTEINKDTTAIEKNTAATEAKVDDLKDESKVEP